MTAFRMGSVPYLNAAPLTHGIEHGCTFLPPSELAVLLEQGGLDAALVSITEAMRPPGREVLDGYGIVSRGPVYSVFLAHSVPLEEIREVHVDRSSCTSVQLLRVLLAERGLNPAFVPLRHPADGPSIQNLLLIGNPAIEFRRRGSHRHRLWDLGEAWHSMTGLPMVFAAWALRSGPGPGAGNAGAGRTDLLRRLRKAAEAGLHQLPAIIEGRREFDAGFRRAYLGGHIQYRIDEPARQGVAAFATLLRQHVGPGYRVPLWVGVGEDGADDVGEPGLGTAGGRVPTGAGRPTSDWGRGG